MASTSGSCDRVLVQHKKSLPGPPEWGTNHGLRVNVALQVLPETYWLGW